MLTSRRSLDPDQLRAYLDRDWGAVRANKMKRWAAQYRGGGAEWSIRVSEALRKHLTHACPAFPDTRLRTQDLQHHQEMQALFARIARGLRKSAVGKVLADLASAFKKERLRWYVFGAQAGIVHGVPRSTADVDVTVDAAGRTNQDLCQLFTRSGFRVHLPDDAFVRATRVIPLIHKASALPVDVVLAGPGIEDLFFERVVHVSLHGTRFPFVSPEDLAAMKVLSGRPKDIEDVRALLAARRGRFDVNEIIATLTAIESALDQSDLVPVFRGLLAESRARSPSTKTTRPARRRRGGS